jgi:hypothetical protein
MKKLIVFVFLFTLNFWSQEFKLDFVEEKEIKFEADQIIGVTKFDEYIYTKNNILYKQTSNNTFQYQNLQLGPITKVDIINPLKIVVFYEEFNSVVLLDSQFNEIQKIEFNSLELKNNETIIVKSIGLASNNRLWLFNAVNQRIALFDLNTFSYNEISNPINNSITNYKSDFNYFYWIDKNKAFNKCSIFGSITTTEFTENETEFTLINNNYIIYKKENSLYLKNLKNNSIQEIVNVKNSIKNFYYKEQILSIFTNKGITNYKITIE